MKAMKTSTRRSNSSIEIMLGLRKGPDILRLPTVLYRWLNHEPKHKSADEQMRKEFWAAHLMR